MNPPETNCQTSAERRFQFSGAHTGGVQGLVLMKPEAPFGFSMFGQPLNSDRWLYFFTLVVAAIMFLIGWNILRGRIGRALIAIRDHPIAAAALGINLPVFKSITFGVSAAFTSTTTAATPGTLSANPASPDFGGQSMGTTSPAVAVTLANTGGSSLTVSSVSTSTDFAVSHDCASLAPGASCTASVTFTPTAQGSLNGTLTVQSSAGTLLVPLAGTGERSLVTHYYRSILRRAPDAGGKGFWESEAARHASLGANVNETWYAMAVFFFNSPEYLGLARDDAGFVADLFNTFFNRPPDPSGLAFWTGQLAAGMPREVVLVSFMLSPEFVSFAEGIFGSTAARREVDTVGDFYRGLLSRLPDEAGFNFWVTQFRAAQCQNAGAVYAQVHLRKYPDRLRYTDEPSPHAATAMAIAADIPEHATVAIEDHRLLVRAAHRRHLYYLSGSSPATDYLVVDRAVGPITNASPEERATALDRVIEGGEYLLIRCEDGIALYGSRAAYQRDAAWFAGLTPSSGMACEP